MDPESEEEPLRETPTFGPLPTAVDPVPWTTLRRPRPTSPVRPAHPWIDLERSDAEDGVWGTGRRASREWNFVPLARRGRRS